MEIVFKIMRQRDGDRKRGLFFKGGLKVRHFIVSSCSAKILNTLVTYENYPLSLKLLKGGLQIKQNMKSLNIALIAVIMLSMIAMPLAMAAQEGIHEPGTGITNPEIKEEGQGTGQGLEVNTEAQVQVQTGTYMNQAGQQMQVQAGQGNEVKLQSGNVEAKTTMTMTQEKVQDKTKLQVKLSNGMNAEVKVMPNTASETALAKLGAKCEGTCTIELKEVRTGNQVKAAYEIKTQKQAKVLGLFQAQMQVQAQVDAENGEVIQAKKPWWAFLATETA